MKKILLPVSTLTLLTLALPAMAFSPAGEDIAYSLNEENFQGYFVSAGDNAKGSVLIVHDWDGLDDYERQRADMLADEGYDVFAVDLYGEGNRPQAVDDKRAATNRLYQDRERMRALTLGGLAQAREQGAAEQTVIMGYCFGGAVALEIARSGEADNIAAYTSFHGGLTTPEGQAYSSETAPIFIAHGGADSAVSLEDVATLAEELETAGVTYEVGIYSGAPHAFSVFGSDAYHERADQRSWEAFNVWLDEML
ncbi:MULTISPECIES: dienelactone hydrolase family protein [Halomonadaceae]|uniref:Dienelactone hydrolase family protein n=1 Tax=Vreelandella titanicae TaxID=664683 RepID=A0A558J6X0_9GAMM|nr:MULTISPECIES: dienelactone hydrolase family protein [Halomonas]TVU89375.1 dienelactone hydrolase family protein [Halomonas titanicae]CEP36143.1 Putative carboxymethylenebutenolidase [Halomonas sp. R57-5]